MSIEELATGVWDIESSENFEEYLKAVGVGMAMRVIVTKLKPTNTFSIENGEWTMKTLSTFKNLEVKFKIDESFEETTPDGRKVESKYTIEGTKLIKEEKGTPDTRTERDFSQDTMTMTLTANGVTCKRHYKRTK